MLLPPAVQLSTKKGQCQFTGYGQCFVFPSVFSEKPIPHPGREPQAHGLVFFSRTRRRKTWKEGTELADLEKRPLNGSSSSIDSSQQANLCCVPLGSWTLFTRNKVIVFTTSRELFNYVAFSWIMAESRHGSQVDCFFSFNVYILLFLRILSLRIFRFKNETNISFNLTKKCLHPFVLSAKLCMWMPPFLSRN